MSEDTPPGGSGRRGPIATGLLGLALVVGGWKLSTWVPERPAPPGVDEVRRLADDELRRKLDSYTAGPAPYQAAGRLAELAGLVLFVAAGVRMYRTPPPAHPERLVAGEEGGEEAGGAGPPP
jgi:hypothetical protein